MRNSISLKTPFYHRFKGLFNSGQLIVNILLIFAGIMMISCQKEVADDMQSPSREEISPLSNANILGMYPGLPSMTMWELQQARSASAKYSKLENALKDGYVDIHVVIPGMGRHYLNGDLVDGVFDIRKPEILVYNTVDGVENVLVAVEYGFPIPISPDNAPSGFYGDHDEWAKNTGVGMWLLHAWVWKYNPDGVFAHMNPTVP